jgi:hypothetical protein
LDDGGTRHAGISANASRNRADVTIANGTSGQRPVCVVRGRFSIPRADAGRSKTSAVFPVASNGFALQGNPGLERSDLRPITGQSRQRDQRWAASSRQQVIGIPDAYVLEQL